MNANFLKKLLYVPNYLTLPFAGVEISNRSVKYIELTNNKGILSMKNFGEVPIPPEVFNNGEILNKVALLNALKEVKKNISTDFVKISIPEEKSYIFDVEIPVEAKHNIKEFLAYKIEENVPLKLDETMFEYEILDDASVTKNFMASVFAIPVKTITEYTELFDNAALYPISFEIESKMVADSIMKRGNHKNAIIVNIKDNTTIFIGVINGSVRVTSSVLVGESAIKTNLMKSKLFENESDIDSFLNKDFSIETEHSKEIYSSLINVFSIIKDELDKFNQYLVNKFGEKYNFPSKNIEQVILCGNCSTLPGLTKHINQNIKTNIVLANVWINVFDINKILPKMQFQTSLGFVAPIGLMVSTYKKNV